MKDPLAVALGKRGKGIPKTINQAERDRRADQMRANVATREARKYMKLKMNYLVTYIRDGQTVREYVKSEAAARKIARHNGGTWIKE